MGYEAWECSTSLALLVVPEVKYSSSGSSARVGSRISRHADSTRESS
ncbi:Uncharacterised protein [Mycobacteroides abscessus subsp. abscessus]|nr:Uncharacterised protein [Mycobacteroides abscessus subsp. abscessus]